MIRPIGSLPGCMSLRLRCFRFYCPLFHLCNPHSELLFEIRGQVMAQRVARRVAPFLQPGQVRPGVVPTAQCLTPVGASLSTIHGSGASPTATRYTQTLLGLHHGS
jgi:hypothetical protein